jgi:calcineurin-like phosphoesterase family protein
MRRTLLRPHAHRRLVLSALAAGLVAGCMSTPQASADSVTLTPQADAYVSSAATATNFGTRPELRVDASPRQRTYLRFDVALPAGSTITGATLRLFTTSASTGTGYRAYAVADTSWSESGITYTKAPSLGALAGSSSGWATTGYKAVTIPAQYVHTGLTSLGAATTSTTAKSFHSREATNKPQLVVTFSPPAPDPPPPPPPSGYDPVIMAAGDIQPAGTGLSPTAGLLAASPPNAILTLGDNQYETGALGDYNAWYSQAWGKASLKSRTYPTPGNHERGSNLTANYCAYFRGGTNGAAAVDPCPGGLPYYSYDLGAWHLVALDSSGGTMDSAQLQWLSKDLADHPAKCTLAYWHHARYSGGPHGNHTLNNVWASLMAAGVDVALVGHDHNYQRFAPMNNVGAVDRVTGVREFVVGTGGRSHYAVSAVTGQEATNADSYGVLRLTLHPGNYEWSFVPEAGKLFTDSGADLCH